MTAAAEAPGGVSGQPVDGGPERADGAERATGPSGATEPDAGGADRSAAPDQR